MNRDAARSSGPIPPGTGGHVHATEEESDGEQRSDLAPEIGGNRAGRLPDAGRMFERRFHAGRRLRDTGADDHARHRGDSAAAADTGADGHADRHASGDRHRNAHRLADTSGEPDIAGGGLHRQRQQQGLLRRGGRKRALRRLLRRAAVHLVARGGSVHPAGRRQGGRVLQERSRLPRPDRRGRLLHYQPGGLFASHLRHRTGVISAASPGRSKSWPPGPSGPSTSPRAPLTPMP